MTYSRRQALTVGGGTLAGIATIGYALTGRSDPPLQFGDGVDDALRERCRRAYEFVTAETGRSLRAPVTIRWITPDRRAETAGETRFGRIRNALLGVDSPPEQRLQLPETAGRYQSADREVQFAALDEFDPPTLDWADVPPETIDGHPHDPLIAHELTHAVQFDTIETLQPSGESFDASRALVAIIEGTAEYVAGSYRVDCADCLSSPATVSHSAMPTWAVDSRLPYVNGQLFATRTVRNSGWDRLWDLHRNPPETTASMWFPTAEFSIDRTAVPDETGAEWLPVGTDRLGVEGLYLLLWSLDRTRPEPVADERSGDSGLDIAFRDQLLSAWRSDRVRAFEHIDDRDRTVARWETVWASESAARTVATTIEAGYETRLSNRERAWAGEDSVRSVSRDGRRVTIGAGTDHEGLVAASLVSPS